MFLFPFKSWGYGWVPPRLPNRQFVVVVVLFLRLKFNYNVSLLLFIPSHPPKYLSPALVHGLFFLLLFNEYMNSFVYAYVVLNITQWVHVISLVCVISRLNSWSWKTNWYALPWEGPHFPLTAFAQFPVVACVELRLGMFVGVLLVKFLFG